MSETEQNATEAQNDEQISEEQIIRAPDGETLSGYGFGYMDPEQERSGITIRGILLHVWDNTKGSIFKVGNNWHIHYDEKPGFRKFFPIEPTDSGQFVYLTSDQNREKHELWNGSDLIEMYDELHWRPDGLSDEYADEIIFWTRYIPGAEGEWQTHEEMGVEPPDPRTVIPYYGE